ncbi:Putative Flagellin, Flp1-like, domain [Pseudobutyrivibrio sp. ACV-2]|uniref:Flp1 family type IVb pilin n=1 Tax=Pseudobutyrivibrio sp. ACV-2 TaxID=1520801 RepID=UPI00089B9F3E|nr:Flp1 family type IVb pilin [Pseudobutyrivibrio sp. ACV-2]SEA48283.1 Putative Flagellin, Flp1-like, domain [Pseudobutyrivibrio sp. ACV-2]
MNYLMNKIKNFVVEEDGIGTVEMILILVVLIGIVLIFKDNLNSLVADIFRTIKTQAGRV